MNVFPIFFLLLSLALSCISRLTSIFNSFVVKLKARFSLLVGVFGPRISCLLSHGQILKEPRCLALTSLNALADDFIPLVLAADETFFSAQ